MHLIPQEWFAHISLNSQPNSMILVPIESYGFTAFYGAVGWCTVATQLSVYRGHVSHSFRYWSLWSWHKYWRQDSFIKHSTDSENVPSSNACTWLLRSKGKSFCAIIFLPRVYHPLLLNWCTMGVCTWWIMLRTPPTSILDVPLTPLWWI